jgi:hypothetical protein
MRRTLLLCLFLAAVSSAQDARKTRNLIVVTCDGLRWQEVFRGAEQALISKTPGGVSDVEKTKKVYWRETADERRAALMPFLWSMLAKQGQIYGNRDQGSDAYVTNGKNFSYPGYNELFTGYGDPRVDSNDKKENPNVNALEVLNGKPAYRGKVAAFGAWDVFPYILNARRSGLPVNAGYDPMPGKAFDLLNRLKVETGIWRDEALDAPMFHTAMTHLKSAKPRVLYVGLGDTDEWAHAGKYDLYLDAIHRSDAWLKELWDTVQSMPEYRGSTTLVLTVDHGRGSDTESWKSHGEKLPDSKYIWLAAIGPDTKAIGMRSNAEAITQGQVAATLLALLGEGRDGLDAKAAAPIADLFKR